MKLTMTGSNQLVAGTRFACVVGVWLAIVLCCLTGGQALAADEPGLVDKTKEVAKDTTEAVKKKGAEVADEAQQLWARVDAARLKNRTPDQIAAWIVMGMLVGALAGMATSLKSSGMGKLGRLLLGLAGAFIGGIIVHVVNINFGWGVMIIPYEELLFSFLGALLLIGIGRFIRSKSKKQGSSQ